MSSPLTWRKVLPYAAVAVIAAILAGLIVYYAYVRVGSHGHIVTVNINVNVQDIDWGYPAPGENTTRSIVVSNNGNTPVILSIATANFQPSIAEQYLTLRTDLAENMTLPTSQSVVVNLRLEVSPNTTGFVDFSFDIIVAGTKP